MPWLLALTPFCMAMLRDGPSSPSSWASPGSWPALLFLVCFSDRHRRLPASSDQRNLPQPQYVGIHEATALLTPPPSKAACFEQSLHEASKAVLERFFKVLKMEGEGADGQGWQPHCHPLS